jgi:hypothetical protein
MANSSRSRSRRSTVGARPARNVSRTNRQVSSEEAIKAGEQIAMTAFASGLKLAAAFGTVAAKTAGLAFASLASGAEKFSELVKEEALRSNNGTSNSISSNSKLGKSRRGKARRSPRA